MGKTYTEQEVIDAVVNYPGGSRKTQEQFLSFLGIELPTPRRRIVIEVDAHACNANVKDLDRNFQLAQGRNELTDTLKNFEVIEIEDI